MTSSSATSSPSCKLNNHRQIACTICQDRYFPSRNQLFDHLREEHGFQRSIVDENDATSARERTEASLAARSRYFNPNHDAYYRIQCQAGLMPLEEWEQALEVFRTPLTIAFRPSNGQVGNQNEHGQQPADINDGRMAAHNGYWKWLQEITEDWMIAPSPYAPSACYSTRRPLREWPKRIQQAWGGAQDLGIANRQELCSMLPALLLLSDYPRIATTTTTNSRQLTILDLCAAPGSKTLQLLDMLQDKDGKEFKGMVVANDSSRPRLLNVARRARLAGSSTAAATTKKGLILNCSDGRYFPALRKWGGYKLKFDYVLADVPCSGDGTLRKLSSKDWKTWNVQHHLQLHKLQLRLLIRSLQLVQKGGWVVYSTCSLDPIENEAVVASAMAQLGGPSVYRIVPAPKYLQEDATAPFRYIPGASSWMVPHPKFHATDNPTMFESLDQVPEKLVEGKNIMPTMFPPPTNDNDRWKDQLSHCCRILPQHLDSGGFFCAIIERIPPEYYAISCPSQRDCKDNEFEPSSIHGRIYHLANQSSTTAVTPRQQIRALIQVEKERIRNNAPDGTEICEFNFEGLPTLETAQEWLREHRSFLPGRSASVSNFPELDESSLTNFKNKWFQDKKGREKPTMDPIYTPLVQPPHSDLLAEFVDFFGLCITAEAADAAGVEQFPVQDIITVGGGDKAKNIRSNRMGVDDEDDNDDSVANHRFEKSKFLQLVLVSPEIRTLFAGGAKFNPMEMGLSVCWVPVVRGISKRYSSFDNNVKSRAEQSGRYGLMDEAVELVGRCATKRILSLSTDDVIELLQKRQLENANRLWQVGSMPEAGGMIVTCPTPHRGAYSTSGTIIYLSGVLRTDGDAVLELLTESRAADAWLRWLLDTYNVA